MKNFTISGAIFDLDGTLLDSMMIWEDFASAYLRSRGIEPPAGLEARLESLTLSDAAEYLRKAFSLPEGREEILEGMNRTADARYDTVLPKPGVREMLSALSHAGVPMAVATLTDRPTVLRTLSRLGLLSYFSHVFTCAEVGARKDTPVIYEAALAALGTKKAETPVFEDALYQFLLLHCCRAQALCIIDLFNTGACADVLDESTCFFIATSFEIFKLRNQ